MYRIGFIVEQALGHITHAKNLQANVPKDPQIEAHWALPPFETCGLAARLPLYRSNWTVRAGWRTRRALARFQRQNRLDALFFHTQVTAILSPDWLARIPSVVSLDGTPLQYDSLGQFYAHKTDPPWLENIKFRLNQTCYRRARRLVTWSEWAKKSLVDDYHVPPEKITVIPPGVNTAEWLRPAARTAHRGAVKILFVGGNLARKGGDLLLQAFRTLRERHPDIELHLVTRDTVLPEAGVFAYYDVQPNSPQLKQLYFDADIFCLPTQGDMLPMVLSEAAAAGLPVVSTRLAAIPEIVRHGQSGFLIGVGDLPGLVESLERLIRQPDLRLRMGEQAVRVAQEGFDAQQNALRLLGLIKSMVDEQRRQRA